MTHSRRAWLSYASGLPAPELAKSCVEQLDGVIEGANIGLVFFADPTTEMSDAILAILRDGLGIDEWFGGAGQGIIAHGNDIDDDGGLAILCLRLPAHAFKSRRALDAVTLAGIEDQTLWHVATQEHGLPLALNGGGFGAFGGICGSTSEAPLIQIQPVAGGAVGLSFTSPVKLFAGLSRGTRDLGPWRQVTSAVGGSIIELDGQPAARVVEADSGQLLARLPDRLIRQIIVETTSGDAPILMPRLALIERFDRQSGKLDIRDARPGVKLRLVHRQAAPALKELGELAKTLKAAANGYDIHAAILYSSEMRGASLFGPKSQEPAVIARELPGIPTIGLRTRDEIYQGSLTCGAAVLVLITTKKTKS